MMKWLFLMLLVSPMAFAEGGTLIDQDGDNIFCVVEDDGVYCNEDEQDLNPYIPNIYRGDNHGAVDLNGDGVFSLADLKLAGELHIPWAPFNIACYIRIMALEYNRRLFNAGFPPLQVNAPVPFILQAAGPHCFGHHTYPPIP